MEDKTPTIEPNTKSADVDCSHTQPPESGAIRTRKPSLPQIRTKNAPHSLSFAAGEASASSIKGRYAEPDTTEANAERVSICMPSRSRASSTISPSSDSCVIADMFKGNGGKRDDTPKVPVETNPEASQQPLPQRPDLQSRPSMSDHGSKRLSVSSIYSLGSLRAGAVPGSNASANGLEKGSSQRIASGTYPKEKAIAMSQSDTATSNVFVTNSSASQMGNGNVTNTQHVLPRESPAIAADIAKRNAAARGEGVPRGQPPQRSRSRAKREFSSSTISMQGQSGEKPSNATNEDGGKVPSMGIIGVCALDVKARSKPSRNILSRLIAKGEFEVVVFGDKVILDEEVENWPLCDYLISFYSEGFPLDKAIKYVRTRKPFCVNDVPMQKILWDRRICLRILDKVHVPTPKRLEVNRDGGPALLTPELARHLKDTNGVILEGPESGTRGQEVPPRRVELLDDGDTLSVDGALLTKPFVEKPVNGEDHNICVYYSNAQGGGARKLFRKIGNKSSERVPDMITPRAILEPESSYLYEKFMSVDNSEDVKAYTVGPKFCHAETRKSPVVDGLVRRNTYGKEIRYITSLTKEESAMASRIANSFGQRVCGFDLLRAQGKSYVIDVNGWSFVKDNEEYYDHCARLLREMFIKERQIKLGTSAPRSGVSSPGDSEARTSPVDRKEPLHKENHRSTFKSLLAKSPSMSRIGHAHLHHHHHTPGITGTTSPPEFVHSAPPSIKPHRVPHSNTNAPSQVPSLPALPRSVVAFPEMGDTPVLVPDTVPPTPGINFEEGSELVPPPAPKHTWKLKGVVSVIRHADRTPKQKYKYTFHTAPFIELLKGYQEEVLLTGEAALNSVIVAVDVALRQGEEDMQKLRSLRNVLSKKGGWAGTKVQIKPMFRKRTINEIVLAEGLGFEPAGDTTGNNPEDRKDVEGHRLARPPTREDSMSGTTLSRITAAEKSLMLDKLQLIVKWGGEPTHSARYQAQELGENMRKDLLLMNKEVLEEVHVFSSSERRVTTSAQIFTSSFLRKTDYPADFITIRKDLLDDSNAAKDEMDKVKKKLKSLLRQGQEPPPQFAWPSNMPEPSIVQRDVVQLMKFHRKVMRQNFTKVYGGASMSLNAIENPEKGPSDQAQKISSMSQSTAMGTIQARWCCGEDAELFKERWEKLFGEFCDGEKVDPGKISELYDTMKFDALHNRQFLEWVFTPSKSILDQEQANAIDDAVSALEKENRTSRGSDDRRSIAEQNPPISHTPSEKGETSKRNSRSIFGRRAMTEKDEAPEQYFNLFMGSSQTKAKTDARLEKLRELYKLAKVLFDYICPQEYGMTDSEKLEIGLLTSLPLLKEIVQDLEEMQASDECKSFIYFTKESHIYTLMNCILEGGIETKIARSTIPELDYLSQISFELYESENRTPADAPPGDVAKYAYSIRITISPGAHTFDPLDVQLDSRHCISCAPRRSLTAHKDWMEVIETLRAKFHQVKLPKSFLAVNLSESHSFHKKDEKDDSIPALDVATAHPAVRSTETSTDSASHLPPIIPDPTPMGSSKPAAEP